MDLLLINKIDDFVDRNYYVRSEGLVSFEKFVERYSSENEKTDINVDYIKEAMPLGLTVVDRGHGLMIKGLVEIPPTERQKHDNEVKEFETRATVNMKLTIKGYRKLLVQLSALERDMCRCGRFFTCRRCKEKKAMEETIYALQNKYY